MTEKPIAKCQAIKAKMFQDKKGLFIGFLIKEDLLPEEFDRDLRDLRCGEIVNLYVTVDDPA